MLSLISVDPKKSFLGEVFVGRNSISWLVMNKDSHSSGHNTPCSSSYPVLHPSASSAHHSSSAQLRLWTLLKRVVKILQQRMWFLWIKMIMCLNLLSRVSLNRVILRNSVILCSNVFCYVYLHRWVFRSKVSRCIRRIRVFCIKAKPKYEDNEAPTYVQQAMRISSRFWSARAQYDEDYNEGDSSTVGVEGIDFDKVIS